MNIATTYDPQSPEEFRKRALEIGATIVSEYPHTLITGHKVCTFTIDHQGTRYLYRDDGPRDWDKIRRNRQPIERFCCTHHWQPHNPTVRSNKP